MRFLGPIVLLLVSLILPSQSEAETTQNRAHPGYTYFGASGGYARVTWQDRQTDCDACRDLIDQHNSIMDAVLEVRYAITKAEDRVQRFDLLSESGTWTRAIQNNSDSLRAMGFATSLLEEINRLRSEIIPNLKRGLETLEAQEEALYNALTDCENRCDGQTEDDDDPSYQVAAEGDTLPFDWHGPYAEVCHRCAKLAERLNQLPGLLREAMALKIAAELRAEVAQAEIIHEHYEHQYFHAGAPADIPHSAREAAADRIAEYNQIIDEAQEEAARNQRNIDEITRNFAETLALYNDCIATCDQQQACTYLSEGREPLVVGPNDKVGSGREMTDAVKDTAMGVVGGLFGSGGGGLFGSGGGLLGGGGGDEDAREPETHDDPTTGESILTQIEDVGILSRANILDNGELAVSTELDDVPGDGTFHVQWLEDGAGNVYLPTRYLMISLYLKWKLTVSWTYDRYVNNEHVEHRSGKEITTGSEHLGDFLFASKADAKYENSIWHRLGFDTAVEGVRHLVTTYELPEAVKKGPCPLKVVTHVTLPNQDPVVTQPVIVSLGPETMAANDNDKSTDTLIPVIGWANP